MSDCSFHTAELEDNESLNLALPSLSRAVASFVQHFGKLYLPSRYGIPRQLAQCLTFARFARLKPAPTIKLLPGFMVAGPASLVVPAAR